MSGAEIAQKIPGIRPDWSEAAFEAACSDIDVGRLHAAYLRAAQRAGAVLLTRAPFRSARRTSAMDGTSSSAGQNVRAALIVNAAGAWADRLRLLAASRRSASSPIAAR
jgi:D-arginine dehydrogenase